VAQPFIGEIRMGGWNFASVDFASCNGQRMSISQNETLFNLIGTTYGGNGVNTFGLPDSWVSNAETSIRSWQRFRYLVQ
jgi:microcystin-dependent protein